MGSWVSEWVRCTVGSLFFVGGSGGKGGFVFQKKNSSRVSGRGFYGSLIVEIKAGKKKEVDDEQGGSR
jgi:hypothetical protein